MEEIAPILIIVLVSMLSGLAKLKKKSSKATQAAQRVAERRQEEMRLEAEQLRAQHQAEKKPDPIWQQPAAPAYTPVKMGAEGTDDCHAYMLDEIVPASAADEKSDEERPQAANELLRGVIISEILHRSRPAYGRRRA